MNVDGVFILVETNRKTSVLLFVDHSMQIFLRYISLRIWENVSCITLSHSFKKLANDKCFRAEFPRALDFEPWCRELVQCCLNTCNSCMF